MTREERALIQRVARLMAELDDPFADRESILGRAGFERVSGWEALRQTWLDRIAGEPHGEVAQAFGAAYRAAVSGRESCEVTLTPPPPAGLVLPFRSLPATGPQDARALPWPDTSPADPLDQTAELATLVPRPATPFETD